LFDVVSGTQLAKLVPNDGAQGDLFGWSIAIDNGVVAVATWHDDDAGSGSGSVYLFSTSTGQQIVKLLPNDGAANDHFGSSISIDSGIVAIGARNDDDNGMNSGSVYLFSVDTGLQIEKLISNEENPGARFGNSIDMDNGLIAIGSWWDSENGSRSGSAYVFDANTGQQLTKLLP